MGRYFCTHTHYSIAHTLAQVFTGAVSHTRSGGGGHHSSYYSRQNSPLQTFSPILPCCLYNFSPVTKSLFLFPLFFSILQFGCVFFTFSHYKPIDYLFIYLSTSMDSPLVASSPSPPLSFPCVALSLFLSPAFFIVPLRVPFPPHSHISFPPSILQSTFIPT